MFRNHKRKKKALKKKKRPQKKKMKDDQPSLWHTGVSHGGGQHDSRVRGLPTRGGQRVERRRAASLGEWGTRDPQGVFVDDCRG